MKDFFSRFIQRMSSSTTTVVRGRIVEGDLAGRSSDPFGRQYPVDDIVVTESIPFITPPNAMTVEGSFDVEWMRSDAVLVELTAERRLMPYMNIHMDGSRLIITMKKGVSFSTNAPVRVRVQSPSVEDLRLQGSSDVHLAHLQQEHLRIHMQGSGDVTVEGHVVDFCIEKKGSGDLDARALQTRTLDLQQTGSGDSTVWCNGAITINNHGSGDVAIHGHPTTRQVTSHGSGDVEMR